MLQEHWNPLFFVFVAKLLLNDVDLNSPTNKIITSINLKNLSKRNRNRNLNNTLAKSKTTCPPANDILGYNARRYENSNKERIKKPFQSIHKDQQLIKSEKRTKNKSLKNRSVNKEICDEITNFKCLTNRKEGLEPTDLGAKEPLQPGSNINFPDYEEAKCSIKSNGLINAYAVNTNQGIARYDFIYLKGL